MSVNVGKLDRELRAAGIPIDGVGVNPDGSARVDFRAEATQAQRDQAATIVAAHDPAPTPEDRLDRALGGRVLAALALLRTHDLHLAAPNAGVWGEIDPPVAAELARARAIVAAAGRAALSALRG